MGSDIRTTQGPLLSDKWLGRRLNASEAGFGDYGSIEMMAN